MYDRVGSDPEMSRRPYSYSVLRYVHDIVTGEFVNVGLVLVATGFEDKKPVVLAEFKDRIQRLRTLFPDIDRASFVASMAAMRRAAKGVAKQVQGDDLFPSGDARALASRMLPHDGSSLQWSEIGTGVAKDLQKEFARVCNRMLSSYDRHQQSRRSDEDIWRPVRQAIVQREIPIEFERKVIRGQVDSIEFKHSWKNGKIHAYEPISFDLSDSDNIKDKARKWMGHLTAAHIGAGDQFQAYFIAGKPSDPRLLSAYHSALEILKSAPSSPQVFEESEVDQLVDLIEDGYRHHAGA
jgi:hypothetical protein